MDPAFCKQFTTSRGLKYHYYFSKPLEGKPFLVFLHGFPSTSRDWKNQVLFFKELGYGLVVPDLMGFGGTDKPNEVQAYKMSLMTKDVVELLDAEGANSVIAIGHDW